MIRSGTKDIAVKLAGISELAEIKNSQRYCVCTGDGWEGRDRFVAMRGVCF